MNIRTYIRTYVGVRVCMCVYVCMYVYIYTVYCNPRTDHHISKIRNPPFFVISTAELRASRLCVHDDHRMRLRRWLAEDVSAMQLGLNQHSS